EMTRDFRLDRRWQAAGFRGKTWFALPWRRIAQTCYANIDKLISINMILILLNKTGHVMDDELRLGDARAYTYDIITERKVSSLRPERLVLVKADLALGEDSLVREYMVLHVKWEGDKAERFLDMMDTPGSVERLLKRWDAKEKKERRFEENATP